MSSAHEREAAILARCSRNAAQYITQLRNHPLYLEVLTRLEAIHGNLFELDAEQAFYESLRAERRGIEPQEDPGQDI